MRNLTKMLLAGAVAALMLPMAAQAEIHEQTLRFASAGSEGSPLVQGQRKFAEIVKEKCATIIETGADVVCGADVPCLMNIKGALDRLIEQGVVSSNMKVMHIAQILDSRLEA